MEGETKMVKGWDKEKARHSMAKKFGKAPPYRKKDLTKGAWRKEFGYSQDIPKLEKERNLRKIEEQRIEDEYYTPAKGLSMAQIQADLAGFTGTEQYHQGWAGVKWTDGVAHFFKKYGGWLITDISSYWVEPDVRKEEFQVWTLTVDADKKGILKMTDGNSEKAIKTQKYNYVDLPAGELKFYLQQGVLMLPREY